MNNTRYIDNEAFLQGIIDYKKQVKEAKKNKQERPTLSDELGLCFLKIAEHLARKPNFVAYTFRDEMILDSVENCVQYVDNFNPDRSRNPFSYFTQIIYFAFLRRIAKEKKQLYIKYKATEQFSMMNDNLLHDTDNGGINTQSPLYENITDFIHVYEETRETKKLSQKQNQKKKKKPKGLERFME